METEGGIENGYGINSTSNTSCGLCGCRMGHMTESLVQDIWMGLGIVR